MVHICFREAVELRVQFRRIGPRELQWVDARNRMAAKTVGLDKLIHPILHPRQSVSFDGAGLHAGSLRRAGFQPAAYRRIEKTRGTK